MRWSILDLGRCFREEPPTLDFVVLGLLAKTVGALVAPGATGKSWLALQIGAAVAGVDTLDLGITHHGRVLYLAAEDPPAVLHARLHTLGSLLSPEERDIIEERLSVVSTLGCTGDLLDDGRTAAAIVEAAQGCRLVILDAISRWHSGNENDRGDASRVMRTLERVCTEADTTVLFLHHASKWSVIGGQQQTQQASRGSSVFADEARYLATLNTLSQKEAKELGIADSKRTNYLVLNQPKCNYIPPQPPMIFQRREGGRLEKYERKSEKNQRKEI